MIKTGQMQQLILGDRWASSAEECGFFPPLPTVKDAYKPRVVVSVQNHIYVLCDTIIRNMETLLSHGAWCKLPLPWILSE